VVDLLAPEQAVVTLGQMGGGYNVEVLIELLENESVAAMSCGALPCTGSYRILGSGRVVYRFHPDSRDPEFENIQGRWRD
jgi:hypothetical protein